MKTLNVVKIIVTLILAIGGAGYCFYLSVTAVQPTARETALLNLFIAGLTFGGSWVLSHYYAVYSVKEQNERMINTIALQSSEKILNLSGQIWRLEQFLDGSLGAADSEFNVHAANNTL